MNTPQTEPRTEPKKTLLESMDVSAENRASLKALFPSVFTETLNDKGALVESIDFEKLKAELGTFSDLFEGRKERYGMDWPGKKECLKIIQQPSLATLKPCREESVNFDTTENLFIEGDNLEVLKLLQKSYYGKVKMIYIDPPYNTGKEFIYPDHYAESLDTYLAYAGLVDDKGKKFSTNTANEGRFHTKWLNMMYPRLYLARNLLRENGVIFVSIDDCELSNTRKLLDDIFGEENFIDTIIWKKRYGGGSKEKHLISVHEYILLYAKNAANLENIFVPLTEESINRYYTLKDDNFPIRGPYRTHPLEATKSMGERKNLVFQIPGPEGEITPKRQWLWSRERVQEALRANELEFLKSRDGNWTVHTKQYLNEIDGEMRQGKAFSLIDDIYTQHGTNEIIDLFGNAHFFSFPKPSQLLSKLIQIGSTGQDDIILDFFSGSSTTAHAILDLNKKDACNRKFILVQLPEPCDASSDAHKAGYNTIGDIGKERIRRVINKIKQEVGTQANFDLGFKVLKLDKSNFKVWEPAPKITLDQLLLKLEGHVPHIDPKASQEDILYELLLKSGYLPTAKIEKQQIAGKTVYSIGDGVLMICLESEITREFIEAVAATDPERFICLDHAFKGNDQLKTNAMHAFSSRRSGGNQDVFRTI